MTDIDASGLVMARPQDRAGIPPRQVAAVVVGNALEFYDFLTYAYFAVYIGRAFFPAHDPASSLLASLGAFGAGFVTRPIGAAVIGALGDRIGRKPAMMLSFLIMGGAMLGLALTPSYAQIGLWAPALVLAFRLIQGFALGGEVGPTTAFLIEAAPAHRRGFYGALQFASQSAATIIAGIVGAILASLMTAGQLQDWGWRLAMLIGVVIVPFGLWLRRSLPETLHAADDAALAPDTAIEPPMAARGLGPYRRAIACGLVLLSAGTIATYTLTYMTTYGITTLHLSARAAFGTAIVRGGVGMMILPLSGWLSDRWGRRPMMLIPGLVCLVSLIPAYGLMNRFPTTPVVYGALAWLVFCNSLSMGPVIVTLTEALPRTVRSGVVALVYAVAITVFGGSAQGVILMVQSATHSPLTPGLVWSAAAAAGLLGALLIKETAPARLRAATESRSV